MKPRPLAVHIRRHGEAACGAERRSRRGLVLTDDPERVTCGQCVRTEKFKQAKNPTPIEVEVE